MEESKYGSELNMEIGSKDFKRFLLEQKQKRQWVVQSSDLIKYKTNRNQTSPQEAKTTWKIPVSLVFESELLYHSLSPWFLFEEKVFGSLRKVWIIFGILVQGEFIISTDPDFAILLHNRHDWSCPFGESDGCDNIAPFMLLQLSFNLGAERVGYQVYTTEHGLGIYVHLKKSQSSLNEAKFFTEDSRVLVNDLLEFWWWGCLNMLVTWPF